MKGAIARATEICGERPGKYFMPQQFENPGESRRFIAARPPKRFGATPTARLTSFVSAVGTGGTITGVGEVLKARKPGVQIVAGRARRVAGALGRNARAAQDSRHGRRLRSEVLNTNVYDEVIRVTDADAIATARRLAREEGMLVGISAGANVWAALQVARAPEMQGQDDRDDWLRHRRTLSRAIRSSPNKKRSSSNPRWFDRNR